VNHSDKFPASRKDGHRSLRDRVEAWEREVEADIEARDPRNANVPVGAKNPYLPESDERVQRPQNGEMAQRKGDPTRDPRYKLLPRPPPGPENGDWTTADVQRQMYWENKMRGGTLEGRRLPKSILDKLVAMAVRLSIHLYRRVTGKIYGLRRKEHKLLLKVSREWADVCTRYRLVCNAASACDVVIPALYEIPKFEEYSLAVKTDTLNDMETVLQSLRERHEPLEVDYTSRKLARDMREFPEFTRPIFLMLWRKNHTVDLIHCYNSVLEKIKDRIGEAPQFGPYERLDSLKPLSTNPPWIPIERPSGNSISEKRRKMYQKLPLSQEYQQVSTRDKNDEAFASADASTRGSTDINKG